MKTFFRAVFAEMWKQHRIYFHSPAVYFSTVLWPVLELITIYYMYRPFLDSDTLPADFHERLGNISVEAFLLIGFVGYTFFVNLVESAWRFADERYHGTLEMILLTPVSRIAIMLGNAGSSLFESVWLVTCLLLGVAVLYPDQLNFDLPFLLFGLLALAASAVAWGTLMNSFFLITRDAGIAFAIFQDPISFFSGVRLPVTLFTNWMRLISYLIPLTYCLSILRGAAMQSNSFSQTLIHSIPIGVSVVIMLLLSSWILVIAEKHAKANGTLTLF